MSENDYIYMSIDVQPDKNGDKLPIEKPVGIVIIGNKCFMGAIVEYPEECNLTMYNPLMLMEFIIDDGRGGKQIKRDFSRIIQSVDLRSMIDLLPEALTFLEGSSKSDQKLFKEYENKWTFFSAEDCDIVLAPNKIITQ